MKANVDNKAPKEFVHLQQNLKKAQLEEGALEHGLHPYVKYACIYICF